MKKMVWCTGERGGRKLSAGRVFSFVLSFGIIYYIRLCNFAAPQIARQKHIVDISDYPRNESSIKAPSKVYHDLHTTITTLILRIHNSDYRY